MGAPKDVQLSRPAGKLLWPLLALCFQILTHALGSLCILIRCVRRLPGASVLHNVGTMSTQERSSEVPEGAPERECSSDAKEAHCASVAFPGHWRCCRRRRTCRQVGCSFPAYKLHCFFPARLTVLDLLTSFHARLAPTQTAPALPVRLPAPPTPAKVVPTRRPAPLHPRGLTLTWQPSPPGWRPSSTSCSCCRARGAWASLRSRRSWRLRLRRGGWRWVLEGRGPSAARGGAAGAGLPGVPWNRLAWHAWGRLTCAAGLHGSGPGVLCLLLFHVPLAPA